VCANEFQEEPTNLDFFFDLALRFNGLSEIHRLTGRVLQLPGTLCEVLSVGMPLAETTELLRSRLHPGFVNSN
jgi:hypothetical protein